MNKGIFIIVFTFVTVHKTLDSNLKAFCVSNVYFFDSSYRKNFKFQLRFLVQTSINLHVPKDASLALNIPLMGGGKFSSSQAVMMHRSIRIFYFNYYSLIKALYRQFCQFLRETFQDLQIAFFPFNTVFPLNIILYQLSYSPGNQWFTIQQKKDGILHDLFRRWRCKSCANSLTTSLRRIVVINHGILCQSQPQVTATLPTKHWLKKKIRRCILHVHLLGNY